MIIMITFWRMTKPGDIYKPNTFSTCCFSSSLKLHSNLAGGDRRLRALHRPPLAASAPGCGVSVVLNAKEYLAKVQRFEVERCLLRTSHIRKLVPGWFPAASLTTSNLQLTSHSFERPQCRSEPIESCRKHVGAANPTRRLPIVDTLVLRHKFHHRVVQTNSTSLWKAASPPARSGLGVKSKRLLGPTSSKFFPPITMDCCYFCFFPVCNYYHNTIVYSYKNKWYGHFFCLKKRPPPHWLHSCNRNAWPQYRLPLSPPTSAVASAFRAEDLRGSW